MGNYRCEISGSSQVEAQDYFRLTIHKPGVAQVIP